jgi:hypothetical protein
MVEQRSQERVETRLPPRPAETLEQEAPVLMRFEATGNQAGIVCATSVQATYVGLMDAERETRG